MIQKRSNTKKMLAKAGLGSLTLKSVASVSSSKQVSKFFLEESSLRDINESTTIGKFTSLDTLAPASSFNMLGLVQSTRNEIKPSMILPTLTGKHSTRSKIASDFFLSNLSHRRKNVPRMPTIALRMFEKIIVNRSQNFTTTEFQQKLQRLFPTPKDTSKEIKSITQIDENRKQNALISHGVKVIKALVKDLESIRARTVYEFLGMQLSPEAKVLYNEQYSLVESLDSSLVEIYNATESALMNLKTKSKFDIVLKEIMEFANSSKNHKLIIYCARIMVKIAMIRNENTEAIKLLKRYKYLCVRHKEFDSKVFAYKNLGKCYQNLQRYKTALGYFTKFLQMAWHLNSEKYELHAYDYIGKQFFYLGDNKRAMVYHNKMTLGRLETESSTLRQIGLYKIRLGKDDHTSSKQLLKGRIRKTSMDDEDEDDSSKDEIIHLPTPPPEEEDFKIAFNSKEHSPEERRRRFELEKKKAAQKSNGKLFMGLLRAELIKQKDGRNLRMGHSKRKTNLEDGRKPTLGEKEERTFTEAVGAKPAEQVMMSHLTQNRSNKNFSTKVSPSRYDEDEIVDNEMLITVATDERVRKILEKFRSNLRMIKDSLHVCGLEDEISLSPIRGPNTLKMFDSSVIGSKKSFLQTRLVIE